MKEGAGGASVFEKRVLGLGIDESELLLVGVSI